MPESDQTIEAQKQELITRLVEKGHVFELAKQAIAALGVFAPAPASFDFDAYFGTISAFDDINMSTEEGQRVYSDLIRSGILNLVSTAPPSQPPDILTNEELASYRASITQEHHELANRILDEYE